MQAVSGSFKESGICFNLNIPSVLLKIEQHLLLTVREDWQY